LGLEVFKGKEKGRQSLVTGGQVVDPMSTNDATSTPHHHATLIPCHPTHVELVYMEATSDRKIFVEGKCP
jgi:hypothetical protein